MKNIGITILIILVVAVLGLYLFFFQVRETEVGLVTRFGEPVRNLTEPGIEFKWPAPIEVVHKFDGRMRIFEADLGETTTKGAIPIIVKSYIVWRVEDPLSFYNSVGSISEAENYLRSQLSDTQNTVIGQYSFSEFVNSDVSKIKIDQVQQKMLEKLSSAVSDDYGIKIETLGIKQLSINEDTSKDVFDRMRAERNRKIQATLAQGNAEAVRVKTDADSKKAELLAAAEARAKAIRGEGDAEAAKYYKMLEADPELAMFLRDIEALKKILENRSTIVFSADSEPFKLLKQIPNLESK
ncbi:MAG: protease modulator HflC [Phycisphaerae bacterium]|nr:protease modulator HflC [Phycisphaerae bacterium]